VLSDSSVYLELSFTRVSHFGLLPSARIIGHHPMIEISRVTDNGRIAKDPTALMWMVGFMVVLTPGAAPSFIGVMDMRAVRSLFRPVPSP
jgi:hypothetical protein